MVLIEILNLTKLQKESWMVSSLEAPHIQIIFQSKATKDSPSTQKDANNKFILSTTY